MSNGPRGVADTLAAETRPSPLMAASGAGPDEIERGTLVDRYVVLGKLGAGGMGVVYVAHDPELDRKVALKLLLPRSDGGSISEDRARLLREAQALAKLSHPNVVAVHDVGTFGERVWIAMELVVGETLAVWAGLRPRRWPEVLRMLTETARGVAAAHTAGLVHRDLKPDNVMVGGDGRVRVMDFGLAHGRVPAMTTPDLAATARADSKEQPQLAVLALRLTQAGAIQGTPAYMAPEQWQGQEAFASTDQFGWSVMAWELLYGERPFAGETLVALAANVLSGQRRAPPKGRHVPGWLRFVVERGLATDPARRWPTMEALVAALARGMSRSQMWVTSTAVMGIAAIAAGATYQFAPRKAAVESNCRDNPVSSGLLWGDEQRSRVELALTTTGVSYGQDVWRRVDQQLGTYAAEWARHHADACEAHVTGTQSSHLLDLRSACLGQRGRQVTELIDVLAQADAIVVENAVQAVAALPRIEECSDIQMLMAAIPPPEDATTAERVELLRTRLARAKALEVTGQYQAGLRLAAEVRADAATLGYPPLDAEATLVEGTALVTAGQPEQADAVLSRAIELALAHDLHAIAAEAASKRLFVLGTDLGRPAEALMLRLFAEALVARAGGDTILAALLSNNLGAVHDLAGEHEQARAHYEHSLEVLKRGHITADPILVVIHHNLGGMYLDAGRLVDARAHYVRASELCGTLLGKSHPLSAHPLAGLGDIDAREGRPDDAMRSYGEALAVMAASYGPEHLYLIHPLNGLGRLHAAAGRDDEARRYYERTVQISDRLGAHHPMLAEALNGLAALAVRAGDPTKAKAYSRRAAAMARLVETTPERSQDPPEARSDQKAPVP